MARRVVLIDDRSLRAPVLQKIFEAPEWEIVGEAQTLGEVETMLSALCSLPDVAIVDLEPDEAPLVVVDRLCQERIPSVLIVESPTAPLVERALASGALAVVAKPVRPVVMRAAIESVLNGRRYLCAASRRAPGAGSSPSLTPREAQVLGLIASGRTNKVIAEFLRIAPRTVETHRERLMHKLGAHNAADLTREAMRRGY